MFKSEIIINFSLDFAEFKKTSSTSEIVRFFTDCLTILEYHPSPQPISKTSFLPFSNFETNLYLDKLNNNPFGSSLHLFQTLNLVFSTPNFL